MQVKKIRFSYNGREGFVKVSFRANTGAKSSGFTAIGPQFTDSVVSAFPVIKAEVHYGGSGYEARFGWIQIVGHKYRGRGETEIEVDIAPLLRKYKNPFYVYGYKPTLYDAPCHRPPVSMIWMAYSFLCPLRPSTHGLRMVAPVVGFKWGYELSKGSPTRLVPPEEIGQSNWSRLIENVKSHYSDWIFLNRFAKHREDMMDGL
jgi:hypothetical protein